MRWLLPFFAVFLMVGLTVPDAEARRLGGGKSFGAAPMHKSQPAQRQTPQQQQATPRNQQQNPAATSGASRWLGRWPVSPPAVCWHPCCSVTASRACSCSTS